MKLVVNNKDSNVYDATDIFVSEIHPSLKNVPVSNEFFLEVNGIRGRPEVVLEHTTLSYGGSFTIQEVQTSLNNTGKNLVRKAIERVNLQRSQVLGFYGKLAFYTIKLDNAHNKKQVYTVKALIYPYKRI
jgi:hypothetical protein